MISEARHYLSLSFMSSLSDFPMDARRHMGTADDVDDIRFCPDYGHEGPSTECDGRCTSWVAHSHPERPLGYCAWVCDCRACTTSIRAAAKAKLEIGLVLKSGMDRQIITIDEAVAAMDEHGDEYGVDIAYLRHPDDYMREIFVIPWRRWWPKRRLLVLPGGEDIEVYDGQELGKYDRDLSDNICYEDDA
jgi:hypothetical protein